MKPYTTIKFLSKSLIYFSVISIIFGGLIYWMGKNEVAADIVGSKTIIIIDPGHGASDCDRNYYGDGKECENNFAVAQKVVQKLKKARWDARLTKNSSSENKSLADRSKFANDNKGTLFVSIHSNAGSGSNSGPWGIIKCLGYGTKGNGEADYTNDSNCSASAISKTKYFNKSKAASHQIVNQIKSSFGYSCTSYKASGELQVLDKLNMPAVLIEIFFHDNPKDLAKYNNDVEKMSVAIAKAIATYSKSAK